MRISAVFSALVLVLTTAFAGIATAHAQMSSSSSSSSPSSSSSSSLSSPYPYFRFGRSSSSSSSSSSPKSSSSSSSSSATSSSSSAKSAVISITSPTITSLPKIGASLTADAPQAMPGDEITYVMTVHSFYNGVMPKFRMAFFYPTDQMQVLNTSGGRLEGDHVIYTMPPMGPDSQYSFIIRTRVYKNVRAGTVLRTYASLVWDGSVYPACTHNDVLVFTAPPVTGAGDNTAPLEDTSRFLTPVSSSAQSGWMSSLWSVLGW